MTFAPAAVRLTSLTPSAAARVAGGAVAAAALVAACASSALAGGGAPQLTVGVNVSGSAPQSVNSYSGGMVGTGLHSYVGSVSSTATGAGWYVNWDLAGSDTAVLPNNPSITTGFTVGNTGNTARDFRIAVTMTAPVQVTPGQSAIAWRTVLSGTLTSAYGGTASLVGLAPSMFEGQINGTGVVLNNPSVASTTTVMCFGESVNDYVGSIPGGPNVSTIGYVLSFSLSAHSTATFTGSWSGAVTAVPAPGAVALLGLAGLAGRGRRRRA